MENTYLWRIQPKQLWNQKAPQDKYRYTWFLPRDEMLEQHCETQGSSPTLLLNVAWILRIWKTCNQFVNPFAVCNRQYLHSSQMKLHAIWQLSYLSEKHCSVPPFSNGLNFLFCAQVSLLKYHYQQPNPPPFPNTGFLIYDPHLKAKRKRGLLEN